MVDGRSTDCMFPLVEYNGWKLPGFPGIREDPKKHLKRFLNFDSRESDVLLCTASKSGSHWLFQIVSMLLDHTTDFNSRGTMFDVHFEYYSDYSAFESQTHRRLLHTHFPFRCIPKKHKELGAKIIYLNRNPKDRLVSQYLYYSKLSGTPDNWKWNDFLDEFLRKDTYRGGWSLFTREFTEAAKTYPNMLSVTYEDMKLFPLREIKRIAEFLEVDMDETFLNVVKDKTTFQALKNNVRDDKISITKDAKSHVFRKGEIGEWKEYFTVAQNDEFDALFEKELGDMNLKFIYENKNENSE